MRGSGSENEEVPVVEKVDVGIHIVWLVIDQELQGNTLSNGNSISVQDLEGGIVVCEDCRIEAIQAAGCHEDGSVGEYLCARVPSVA